MNFHGGEGDDIKSKQASKRGRTLPCDFTVEILVVCVTSDVVGTEAEAELGALKDSVRVGEK